MTGKKISGGSFWNKVEKALLRVTELFEYESSLAAGFTISANYSYGDLSANKPGAPQFQPVVNGESADLKSLAA